MRLVFIDSRLGVRNSFKILNTYYLIVKQKNWDAKLCLTGTQDHALNFYLPCLISTCCKLLCH